MQRWTNRLLWMPYGQGDGRDLMTLYYTLLLNLLNGKIIRCMGMVGFGNKLACFLQFRSRFNGIVHKALVAKPPSHGVHQRTFWTVAKHDHQ